MKIYVLLLFVVGCWGIQWKAIDNFKEAFKEHSEVAADTISAIENILETTRIQSELFLNKTYSDNPVVKRATSMRSSDDKCFAIFIDQEDLKFSFQIQLYQLQVPLRNRMLDIREILSNINSSIDIYQKLAESKLRSCGYGSCLEKINPWLESRINSLSCAIYPNCSEHSIRKRSVCSGSQFRCSNGGCISSYYYCDRSCTCGDCSDEPIDCKKSCSEFRCRDTWRCIPYSRMCNGIDDCGDGTDEDGCPPTTTPSYTQANCSVEGGDFLCSPNKCIALEKVCDGYNDCENWYDELDCENSQCPHDCAAKGGVCLRQPGEAKCLYECPPGTYETSEGCSRNPEVPLSTLIPLLEDTPRLTKRYAVRLKFLKTKTTLAISKALREIVRCKKEEFTLLSRIIDYSPNILEERDSQKQKVDPNIPVNTSTVSIDKDLSTSTRPTV